MKLLIVGATGRMGETISELAIERGNEVVCGVADIPEKQESKFAYPIYPSLDDVDVSCDVLIDFSSRVVFPDIVAWAKAHHVPVVSGTTGFGEKEEALMKELSQETAVFHAKNMSLGIAVMERVCTQLASWLPDFDIEIVEAHHKFKKDAPSGTAIALFDAVKEARPDAVRLDGRSGMGDGRSKDEVGINSVRGGTIVGEHKVIFAGEDEVLELTHQAGSRRIFANGALIAAEFVKEQKPGIYDMQDVLAQGDSDD